MMFVHLLPACRMTFSHKCTFFADLGSLQGFIFSERTELWEMGVDLELDEMEGFIFSERAKLWKMEDVDLEIDEMELFAAAAGYFYYNSLRSPRSLS